MIDRREILRVAEQTSLNPHVVEKDYVLGWLLAGIYAHPELRDSWVFKGGTCLKKCFFETYRFSEDLDFTLRDAAQIDETFLRRVFNDICSHTNEASGIEFPPDRIEFELLRNPRGNLSAQGKISYRGPVSPTHALPRIKLDITADERIVLPPVRTAIFHPYSDGPAAGIEVLAYDYIEAFAEKFRALAERTRPRDLYDVIHLYRNASGRPDARHFVEVLREKCAFKGIDLPRISDLVPHRAELEAGWRNMLDHQLPDLLPVDAFWNALPEVFAWLDGAAEPALPAMEMGSDHALVRDRFVDLPQGRYPQNFIETIRFAAANRLIVELDYEDMDGNRSTREIEAYSLRRTADGNVLLMAVRAQDGQPRSYRVESIFGAKTTQKSFSPRYPVELTPIGPQTIPPTKRMPQVEKFAIRREPRVGATPTAPRARIARAAGGPTYVFKCNACGRTFRKKSYDSTLGNHKNSRTGFACFSSFGSYVRTDY